LLRAPTMIGKAALSNSPSRHRTLNTLLYLRVFSMYRPIRVADKIPQTIMAAAK